MSFIRPEAQAQLWRIRELLVAAAAVLLGLYWVLGPKGLVGWIGWLLIAAGVALAVVGLRRLQFGQTGRGPGVVKVDEGQIAYFGPLTGGAVALSELTRLSLDRAARPAHWVLDQPGSDPLHIPVNAAGADVLFDTFAALPGLRTGRMLTELNSTSRTFVVLWQKSSHQPVHMRLH